MDLNELKAYCGSKKGATHDFPFDDVTLVYRVGSKMFALIRINENPIHINLKCDPLMAQDLRLDYSSIKPGYHMNKKFWNTVVIDGNLSDEFIKNLIDISYSLVFNNLTQKQKELV